MRAIVGGAICLALVLARAAAADAADGRAAAWDNPLFPYNPRWEQPFGPFAAECRPAALPALLSDEAQAACDAILEPLVGCEMWQAGAFWRAYDALAAEFPGHADPARSIADVVAAVADEASLCDAVGGIFLWHSLQDAETIAGERRSRAFEDLLAAAAESGRRNSGPPRSTQYLPPPAGPALLVLADDACAPGCRPLLLRCLSGEISGSLLALRGAAAGRWLAAGDFLRLLGGGERLALFAVGLERDAPDVGWTVRLKRAGATSADRLLRLGSGPGLDLRIADGTEWSVPFADADRSAWADFAGACDEA